MKSTLIIIILVTVSCAAPNNLINSEPHLYTVENGNGIKTTVKSHQIGKIPNTSFDHLKNYLTEIVDYDLDFQKKIVINFIDSDPKTHQKNHRVPWDIFYGNLKDDLNSIEPCNHIWSINKNVKNLYYYHGKTINWTTDEKNYIRELFFKYNGLNGGFVIIKPDGHYFLKRGEYTKSNILNTLKDF